MATQTLYSASGNDPGDGSGPQVQLSVTFDDQTLTLDQLVYSNLTDKPAAFQLVGTVNQTYTAPANTTSSIDISGAGVTVVKTDSVGKFGPQTSYSLPLGETMGFSWPA